MVEIKITLPGEQLVIRIWETVEKAGIGLFRPLQLRREGVAIAEVEHRRRLAMAQAERDAADIEGGRASYDMTTGQLLLLPATGPAVPTLTSPASEPSERATEKSVPRLGDAFATRLSQSVALRELRQAINLERIVQIAEEEARGSDDSSVSDEPVHPDWLARWRDNAQDVTDEDVQRLWAAALAGEVKAPGRYSLRLLDFLRSVSTQEANHIAKLGPLSFFSFIYKDSELLAQRGLISDNLAFLQDIGILAGVGGPSLQFTIQADDNVPDTTWLGVCCELGVQVVVARSISVSFPIYNITALGRELLRLGKFQADRNFLVSFAKSVAFKGAQCQLGPVRRVGEDRVEFLEEFETYDPPAPPR